MHTHNPLFFTVIGAQPDEAVHNQEVCRKETVFKKKEKGNHLLRW